MNRKLFDSELKVLDVLWKEGDLPAGQIAKILKEEIGWNRNTTYTVIKKCIEKGAIQRLEPNFMCRTLVTREQVQHQETNELIDKMFDGSTEKFFAAFLGNNDLSAKQVEHLRKLIDDLK
ncbi:MAG: BlaI/MecI/CopY family transcriptional regulator [Clostridiales bacterium]|nr:BlaI/MecI/CopY family transcriptional regulator [Clostridiales bacterium]